MKIGVNSVLFGGHDMETAFRYTKAAGYDGIEISAIKGMSEHLVLDRWQQTAARAKQLSREYDLPITAIEQPFRDLDLMTCTFEAAVEMGCLIVNTGPGGEKDKEETFQPMLDALGTLSELAGRLGVTLCVKAHVGQAVYNTPTSVRMLDAINHPAFGLDMDPSHIHRAGENPVEAIAAVVARIRHVHIRDCKGRQDGPGIPEMQANGRGDIDLLSYVRVLHENKYAGPVNLEVIGAKEYELTRCAMIAAESRGHLRACLQACHAV